MSRLILLFVAYFPIIIFELIVAYLKYLLSVKKYRRRFFVTLRKNGLPRRVAKELVKEMKYMRLRDFLRYGNMRNIL